MVLASLFGTRAARGLNRLDRASRRFVSTPRPILKVLCPKIWTVTLRETIDCIEHTLL